MSSPSTQFAPLGRIGMYDPIHHVSMWESAFKSEICPNTSASIIVEVDASLGNKSDYTSYESVEPLQDNQEASRMPDKVQRRLAQNREAARKSRLRKKAYVRELETCRLKLMQLEQELEKVRPQSVNLAGALNAGSGHIGLSVPINSVGAQKQACILHPCITAFEMEYGRWIEEQERLNQELRKLLQAHTSDSHFHVLVETGLNHYYNLFCMKAVAAKVDVLYLISGSWRTSVERPFLWLGGFRPSELLNLLMPQLEPLTDQQHLAFGNLKLSSQQAEDALTQGMDRLHQILAQSIAADPTDVGDYSSQMASGIEKLDAMESFVNQADHLRRQTLQQTSRILTIRQAARGLLALGDYFQRLRALSSIWAARTHEPA